MTITHSDQMAPNEPGLVTAREVAKLLNVSTRTLWRLRSSGQLPPPIRLGGNVRWNLEIIKKWIAGGCEPGHARENDSTRSKSHGLDIQAS